MKKFILIFLFALLYAQNLNATKNEKNIIYVYSDIGVSQESLRQTILNFKNFAPKGYFVKKIDANEIIENKWINNTALIIIPGGASLPYSKKLDGKGNENIKNFVKSGGSFLGICAGSYYGTSFVEFDKGGPLEVLSKKELEFFPGLSIGPALSDYNYKNNSGARVALINLSKNKKINLYFNGGGYFYNANNHKNINIIGRYGALNNEASIIFSRYGSGKVLLSMVHFEYNPNLMDHNDIFLSKIISELKSKERKRISFNKKIIKMLL